MQVTYTTSLGGHMRQRFGRIVRTLEVNGDDCIYHAESVAEWEIPGRVGKLVSNGKISADLLQQIFEKYGGLRIPFGLTPSLGENWTTLEFKDEFGVTATVSDVAWSSVFENDMLKEVLALFKRVELLYPFSPYGPDEDSMMDFLEQLE